MDYETEIPDADDDNGTMVYIASGGNSLSWRNMIDPEPAEEREVLSLIEAALGLADNEGYSAPRGELREDGTLEVHWKGKDYVLGIARKE